MNENSIDPEAPEPTPDDDRPPVFADPEAEKRYWHSRTPEERLQEVGRLRRIKYGAAALGPMARVLEIVDLQDYY